MSATPGGADDRAAITVKRSADDAVVLSNIQGTNWGFSPDDQRFAYHYELNGQHFVFLYDLSQSPAKKLWEKSSLPSSSRIQFSPTGRYFFYSYVTTSPTGIETSNLEILDAHTGAIRHRRSFILHTAPGDDNTLGAATWGFSPTDGRFVYAHLTSAGQSDWTLVNLETGAAVVNTTITGTAFWKFSPCGDLIALQVQSTATQQNVRIFRTSDGTKVSPAAHETVSVANVELSTTPTEHVVRIGETHYTLPNTAGEACDGGGGGGGGGGNAVPVASFSVPVQPKALVPLDFTEYEQGRRRDDRKASLGLRRRGEFGRGEPDPRVLGAGHLHHQPDRLRRRRRVRCSDEAARRVGERARRRPTSRPHHWRRSAAISSRSRIRRLTTTESVR